jgi:hypothetical protein
MPPVAGGANPGPCDFGRWAVQEALCSPPGLRESWTLWFV